VQGGCNYQVGAWVFGIQGDYDWTNINSNVANAIPAAVAFGLTDNAQFKSLASVTGRVGYGRLSMSASAVPDDTPAAGDPFTVTAR
jgi:hypothetical protein